MRKKLFIVVLLGLFCSSAPLQTIWAQTDSHVAAGPELKTVTLTIGKATMTAEVAATPAEGERGLMYRSHLADNAGMIFVLPVGHAMFWMKNTLIPLSVAYLDKNGVIVEIHDMKPMDETITRSDSDQIAYALEANLHWFSLNGIKPGTRIDPPPATLTNP